MEPKKYPQVDTLGFPCGSACKESACNAGDLVSIPGLARSPGEGKGYTPQNSGLENSMGCRVHGVTELDTTERLSLSLPCYFLPSSPSLLSGLWVNVILEERDGQCVCFMA